ncbi:MAG: helix-turn-helix transcriptional regulator [Alphaproteobacteria bacterium]
MENRPTGEKEKMTISPNQIRAARAMKNWTQSELAKCCDLAVPTIANIEIEKQKPSAKTLEKIKRTLEIAGIEFIDNFGIRKKKQNVQILRGQKGYIEHFDMVLKYATEGEGYVYQANVDETRHRKWFPDFFSSEYFQKMTELNGRVDFKIMVKEGDTFFPAQGYATYRWIPKAQFSPIPFEVFGDTLSIKLFFDEPIIFVIKNKQAANLYREKFLKQWEKSLLPSKD